MKTAPLRGSCAKGVVFFCAISHPTERKAAAMSENATAALLDGRPIPRLILQLGILPKLRTEMTRPQ